MSRYLLPFSVSLLLAYYAISCRNSGSVSPENVKKGEELFNSSGCLLCHSFTDENRYGPRLDSLNNHSVVIRRGTKTTVKKDRAYIIRSVEEPGFEKPEGYEAKTMPPANLTSEQIRLIADYLLYLNDGGTH